MLEFARARKNDGKEKEQKDQHTSVECNMKEVDTVDSTGFLRKRGLCMTELRLSDSDIKKEIQKNQFYSITKTRKIVSNYEQVNKACAELRVQHVSVRPRIEQLISCFTI